MPTMPDFERLGDAPDARGVARVEVRGETEGRVVRDAQIASASSRKRISARDRTEGLLARQQHVERDAGRARVGS